MIAIILILSVIILLLSLALYTFIKKSIYLNNKEKEFINFVIDIFEQYGDDLGIQSKEEFELICKELDKIKNILNNV
jgi:hypothetical protein